MFGKIHHDSRRVQVETNSICYIRMRNFDDFDLMKGENFQASLQKNPFRTLANYICELSLSLHEAKTWCPKKENFKESTLTITTIIPDLLSCNTVDFLVLFLDDHRKLPRHDAGNKNPCIGLHLLGQLMSCKEYIQDICK